MASIQKLSNEIWKDILDHIESNPQVSVAIDRRNHLSVESFRRPSPPLPSQAHDIGSFRRTCRRFSELGASYQFARVSLRFSPPGFRRLDDISSAGRLAKHTKKFSYLVPPFYSSSKFATLQSNSRVLTRRKGALYSGDTRYHAGTTSSQITLRAKEQKKILQSGEDVRILRKAMAAFTSLQHIQILRVIEPTASQSQPFIDAHWSRACTHAIKTMSEALTLAHSPFSRFSGPMMNPDSVLLLQETLPRDMSSHASRLTCLELHFDGPDLRDRMLDLSGAFRKVFFAAKNLSALHVGFPSRTPVDLRLEQIFHGIHWQKLRAFGIQAWRLDDDEIIELARLHKKTLRGLRLRDVQLKDGSRWKDVLSMLRTEMEELDWVSLRRIDYENHFDEIWSGSVEVPDEPPGGASDSDDEADFRGHVGNTDSERESSEDESDEDSVADSDHGPNADELALSPDTPSSLPFCTCTSSSCLTTAEDLGDNGTFVTYQQRKMWEKWVVKRCPEHSSR